MNGAWTLNTQTLRCQFVTLNLAAWQHLRWKTKTATSFPANSVCLIDTPYREFLNGAVGSKQMELKPRGMMDLTRKRASVSPTTQLSNASNTPGGDLGEPTRPQRAEKSSSQARMTGSTQPPGHC